MHYTTIIQRFEPVQLKEKVRVICDVCKKGMYRTIIARQTVNPFNKNEDGSIKTRMEVYDSVKSELRLKLNNLSNKKYYHEKCLESQRKNG